MSRLASRREFLQAAAAGTAALTAGRLLAADAGEKRPGIASNLVLNDDGHCFLLINDDLTPADLRRYLGSYCREGVGAVAYCVGDMTWPTLYPAQVGVHYTKVRDGAAFKLTRFYRNVDRFAAEPGGYFGEVFRTIHGFGKKVLASFRMNDAHFTSKTNTHVSEFWKQHAELSLGSAYGYYGGCLNYASEVVRDHFKARVEEFVKLYPEIDGIELDGMRSPFFFPPATGPQHALLFTRMVREIKAILQAEARQRSRPEYLLSINVPLTPEVALECGLDVAAWDEERLFDWISAGTYQAIMKHPMEQWKKTLKHGTPVFAYIGCSPQTGQYLGLEEYRAAAANTYGSGGDGVYLFNYPCLFELTSQISRPLKETGDELADLRRWGHPDLTKVGQSLDEMSSAALLRKKDKRFLFYWSNDTRYRHYDPDIASLDRAQPDAAVAAVFRCYENGAEAKERMIRFKLENVARSEQFEVLLNGRPVDPGRRSIRYAPNGRDTRIHTVKIGPYQQYDLSLGSEELLRGENVLEIKPVKLLPGIIEKVNLIELEVMIRYG